MKKRDIRKAFEQCDVDDDGRISRAEFKAFYMRLVNIGFVRMESPFADEPDDCYDLLEMVHAVN